MFGHTQRCTFREVQTDYLISDKPTNTKKKMMCRLYLMNGTMSYQSFDLLTSYNKI